MPAPSHASPPVPAHAELNRPPCTKRTLMTAKHFIVGNQNGPEPADRPISVLLVDDQAIVAESIRRLLASQDDIQLHVCHEPSQALAMAKAVRPTVILQDLVMPNIDGLLLVKFFRASEATRQT